MDIHDSFLVLNQDKAAIIQYQYQMLRKFKIMNLLQISSYNEDSSLLLYYLINHKDTLKNCLKEKTFMYPLLKKLVDSLLTVIDGLHQYLLDENQLLLGPEYIFYDRLEEVFYFVFLPCEDNKGPIKEQVFQLFDLLIQNVNVNDYKAVSLIHRLRIAVENNQFNTKEIKVILGQMVDEDDYQAVTLNSAIENKKVKKEKWIHRLFKKTGVLYE